MALRKLISQKFGSERVNHVMVSVSDARGAGFHGVSEGMLWLRAARSLQAGLRRASSQILSAGKTSAGMLNKGEIKDILQLQCISDHIVGLYRYDKIKMESIRKFTGMIHGKIEFLNVLKCMVVYTIRMRSSIITIIDYEEKYLKYFEHMHSEDLKWFLEVSSQIKWWLEISVWWNLFQDNVSSLFKYFMEMYASRWFHKHLYFIVSFSGQCARPVWTFHGDEFGNPHVRVPVVPHSVYCQIPTVHRVPHCGFVP